MMIGTLARKIAVIAAIVGLCAFSAGCVSDMATPTAASESTSHQLRYYGGPKSPMWASQ